MGDETADTIRDAAQTIRGAASGLSELQEVAGSLDELADEVETDDHLSPRQVARGFAERHPAIITDPSTNKSRTNSYYFEYEASGSPGKTNVGSSRTDAEEWVEDQGYEISINMIESIGSGHDGDVLVSLRFEPGGV